jgi:hypothetical protein
MDLTLFVGNCPGNVSKDAKYVVRAAKEGSGSVVALTYKAPDDERWYVTTEDHPELVDMVNEVKIAAGGSPHGPFYINEYQQVIVPAGPKATYYVAGEYATPLRFEFEGNYLSGEGVDLSGRPLRPGDIWVGPHPGIPYVLKAGGRDIVYEYESRPNVSKIAYLSKLVGSDVAQAVARRIRDVKGFEGGRFYVNEWRRLFAPVQRSAVWQYVYIGELDLSEGWFPKPGGPSTHRMRVTMVAAGAADDQLRALAGYRHALWKQPGVTIEPAASIRRDSDGRLYFEFEIKAENRGAIEVMLKDRAVDTKLTTMASKPYEECANCGHREDGELPAVCPSCKFRDISPCPLCGCDASRNRYVKIGGELFRCPGCRQIVQMKFNDPVFDSDGNLREPIVILLSTEK